MARSLQENLARQLRDSVDRLQKQAENVEFWASAVVGLSAPVPEYKPEETAIARYIKPRRKRRRGAANPNKSKPASA